jgi:hypothetical protein
MGKQVEVRFRFKEARCVHFVCASVQTASVYQQQRWQGWPRGLVRGETHRYTHSDLFPLTTAANRPGVTRLEFLAGL